jgi:hypothetical protein
MVLKQDHLKTDALFVVVVVVMMAVMVSSQLVGTVCCGRLCAVLASPPMLKI